MAELLSGGLGIVVVLFLLVIAVLWFFLPFAVFGIKDELRKQHAELQALHKSTKVIANRHAELLNAIRASLTTDDDESVTKVESAPPLNDSPDESAQDAVARLQKERDRWKKGHETP